MDDIVRIEDNERKVVCTLNTWGVKELTEGWGYLEEGYWVHFGSTAIGHTRAFMTECEGIDLTRKRYGDRLIVAYRQGYGDRYCRLKEV